MTAAAAAGGGRNFSILAIVDTKIWNLRELDYMHLIESRIIVANY